MTDIRPLRTEADYDAALQAIEPYFETEPAPGTSEADRFDLLALVIADYEARRCGSPPPAIYPLILPRQEARADGLLSMGEVFC